MSQNITMNDFNQLPNPITTNAIIVITLTMNIILFKKVCNIYFYTRRSERPVIITFAHFLIFLWLANTALAISLLIGVIITPINYNFTIVAQTLIAGILLQSILNMWLICLKGCGGLESAYDYSGVRKKIEKKKKIKKWEEKIYTLIINATQETEEAIVAAMVNEGAEHRKKREQEKEKELAKHKEKVKEIREEYKLNKIREQDRMHYALKQFPEVPKEIIQVQAEVQEVEPQEEAQEVQEEAQEAQEVDAQEEEPQELESSDSGD